MFQSTHPHGVRLLSRISYNSSLSVSIHAPTRGATSPPLHLPAVPCRFNPRTHTGCDLKERRKELVGEGFQSTHPHGVRLSTLGKIFSCTDWFQSTHPHGVRHRGKVQPVLQRAVSIHAPTRGATIPQMSSLLQTWSFNPRTHTGCDDLSVCYAHSIAWFQSTHPHGVRLFLIFLFDRFKCFNPRTHTGCDPLLLYHPHETLRFNPRTHTGCDSCHSACSIAITSFNPRTHTGCDPVKFVLHGFLLVSIHAPTRGATLKC